MTRLRDRQVTVVSFHAHPDDEALLTAGTLSMLSAEGHRVVLVVATSGDAGLAAPEFAGHRALSDVRIDELRTSARALGVTKVVLLEYADSGCRGPEQREAQAGQPASRAGSTARFVDVDVEVAAQRLAAVLRAEEAEVLTTYDRHGGYGHPDHVQVHQVGARAAELAGTPVVLEATLDRTPLTRLARLLRLANVVVSLPQLPRQGDLYTARSELTHRIDVRDQWTAKRAALSAHVSQTTSASEVRTLALLLRLPPRVFRRVFRYEWFREPARSPGPPFADDILQTLLSRPPGPVGARRRPLRPT